MDPSATPRDIVDKQEGGGGIVPLVSCGLGSLFAEFGFAAIAYPVPISSLRSEDDPNPYRLIRVVILFVCLFVGMKPFRPVRTILQGFVMKDKGVTVVLGEMGVARAKQKKKNGHE